MAELIINKDETPGIAKVIDEGAYDLILQAVQEDIYSTPIPSFVREAISNALDAHTERDIAIAILRDSEPVEKYYRQEQDGMLLKDSEFDELYYSLDHLRTHSSPVEVEITNDYPGPRALMTIKDYGVGLAGNRLRGFFKVGYSSKRNLSSAIGKFGAGAKAALATGVEYFTMTTRYNGFETSFMIYRKDYEPVTPQDDNGFTEEWPVQFTDGTKGVKEVHWTPTTEDNGVTISLEVKMHNLKAFGDAVILQFQYFDGRVALRYHSYDWQVYLDYDGLNRKPLYSSETLMIPEYSTYYTPHILVDGIAYGTVNWKELELEQRRGKIAIKVTASDVDITQSREQLKWTEKTKEAILKAVEIAKSEASQHVTTLLGDSEKSDIFKVLSYFEALTSTESTDAVAKAFGDFLHVTEIKPKFKLLGMDFPLDDKLFKFMFYNFHVKVVSVSVSGNTTETSMTTVSSFEEILDKPVVISKKSPLSAAKVGHIIAEGDGATEFVYIRPDFSKLKTSLEAGGKVFPTTDVMNAVGAILEASSNYNLDEMVVENDTGEEVGEGVTKIVIAKVDHAKIRRMNKEVLYTYRKERYGDMVQKKATIKIGDIPNQFESKAKLLLVTSAYKDLGRMIEYLESLHPLGYEVIYVAQENLKHFLPYGTFIIDYFNAINLNTKELVVPEHLFRLNTIRQLDRKRVQLGLNIDYTHNVLKVMYPEYDKESIVDYNHNTTYTSIVHNLSAYGVSKEAIDTIEGYLDNLVTMQDVIVDGNLLKIAETAKELFIFEALTQIVGYDKDLVSEYGEKTDALIPARILLDYLEKHWVYEVSEEIKELINFKLDQNVDI